MTDDYNAKNISVQEGLEGVRKRPAMYIGSTDTNGLHHLVYEVVDNSIDEAMAGYCDDVTVELQSDGSVIVTDDGRGIPVDQHEEQDMPAVEVILTVLHAGGKFDNNSYETSGGLHGVGVSVVNALSERFEARIKRDGALWTIGFEYGQVVDELSRVRSLDEDEETGTEIQFWPDEETFETTEFLMQTLEGRLRELAFLNPGVSITLSDERDADGDEYTFEYEGGISEFVAYLNESKQPLHDEVIQVNGEEDGVRVSIALQATDELQSSIHSFANNINTREGGTHMTGFKTSLTRIINDYAKKNEMLDDVDSLSGNDIREGLTCVISVKHPDPQFEGQTKTKLGNSNVRGIVAGVMHDKFQTYLSENPDSAQAIVSKAIEAAKARQEAKKAKEAVRKKTQLSNSLLPGKLSDCSQRNREGTELFIVEGDSASSSAKMARDSSFQAILPLRGKLLNVEKNRFKRILEHDQIENIIKAIGAEVKTEDGEAKLVVNEPRYERIVIMTDADVDGAHIRTLLLNFFYRYMPELLEEGRIYAAVPPLFRIRKSGETYDVMNERELAEVLQNIGGDPDQQQRFKGLGEMNPDQLWNTTMNPESRVLKQIGIDDPKRTDRMSTVLMGNEVAPRREFIRENAGDADWVDV